MQYKFSFESRNTQFRIEQLSVADVKFDDSIIDHVIECATSCFDHLSPGSFCATIFPVNCDGELFLIYSDKNLVGFIGIKSCGEDPLFVSITGAMLPQYRKYGLMPSITMDLAKQIREKHASNVVYFTMGIINPRVYRLLNRLKVQVWPHPENSTPVDLLEYFENRNAELQNNVKNTQQGIVCLQSNFYLQKTDIIDPGDTNPFVNFYLKHNPNYSKGSALLVGIQLPD